LKKTERPGKKGKKKERKAHPGEKKSMGISCAARRKNKVSSRNLSSFSFYKLRRDKGRKKREKWAGGEAGILLSVHVWPVEGKNKGMGNGCLKEKRGREECRPSYISNSHREK